MVTKETKLYVAIALVSAMYGREQWAWLISNLQLCTSFWYSSNSSNATDVVTKNTKTDQNKLRRLKSEQETHTPLVGETME